MGNNDDIVLVLKSSCLSHLRENLLKTESCLAQLNEDELWFRKNESSNSIGNLILHLNGNITQYILSALGGSTDKRERDKEFQPESRIGKNELLEIHQSIIHQTMDVIQKLDESALLKKRMVQGFEKKGIEILIHVVEHYSYHTGQIAWAVKELKNKDLGFYKDMNLNQRNQE